MLHLVLGRVSSGKTAYLHNRIGEALDGTDKNAVLIVPEQFTFETDRGILNTLGAVKSNRVDVYSFTRLAETLSQEYGCDKKPVITEPCRLILMSRALREVQDKLVIYRSHIEDKAFISKMILVVNEFKQSANDTASMRSIVDALPESLLKNKMSELMLICDAYDAVVAQSYTDTGDVLTDLADLLAKENYFKGRTVALDGFSSFNAQIMKIIGRIMVQCSELYITLTADSLRYSEGENDVFAFTRRTASHLVSLANKNSVSVAKPVFISKETTGFSPYASVYLEKLENSFYKPSFEVCADKTDDIVIYCAGDIDDECAFTARKIRQLNRSGIRCRDIAVIYRDGEKYENKLKSAFRKYEIPVFEDKREPIENQPLVLFVKSALKICETGFSTENIMRFVKTGLSPLDTREISEIENYVYMWSIDGAKWKNEWLFNPSGFTDREPDKEKLSHINSLREKITEPLMELREKTQNRSGKEISREIYSFLRNTGTDKRLCELAVTLEKDGEYSLALEQEQIWDMLMETLSECALSLGDEAVGLGRYLDAFELSLCARTLGKIPNGIDEVTVGSASRIKTRNTDIVFVLGLNAGVFPAVPGTGGLLSDKDKTVLLQNGLELFDINKYKSLEERFIAYNAVCRARKKVFLSYSLRSGANAEKQTKSEIITLVERQFPNLLSLSSDMISEEEKIEGKEAAFELLASHFRENGYYSKNLLAYFSAFPSYAEKTESLRRASCGDDFRFKDSAVSKELFGMNMYLSASRIEEYQTCPFRYFCRYGIGAQPRRKAMLDPAQSGTVIHYVLEKLVRKYSEEGVENITPQQRGSDIREALSEYAEKSMGGLENKDLRFNYHFNRLAKILDTLFDRLAAELGNSYFRPCEFELEIGEGKKIAPYEKELSDGGKIRIYGYIDRVDEFELDGKKYLRVIDYKTGKKEMLLSDVLSGLNMQMLIYLFALCKNGKEYFGENTEPAGVLYFPARFSPFSAGREDGEEQIQDKILKNGKMNGIILDDSRVINAMDCSGRGVFIPVKYNSKTGAVSGNLMSRKQFALLSERIDKILSDMALSLHSGYIPADPVSGKNHEHTCESCDYKYVCGHEESGRYRHIEPEKFEESIKKLEGGGENGKKLD